MTVNRNGKVGLFIKSIWFFPALLTLLLALLTLFQISGSSIGIYHTFFYGDSPDPELLFAQPESIRSDEWVVNSQKAIAQKNNDFEPVNHNFGNGEDATLLGEMPYTDWSIIFKPQNLGFFVLPFDHAFSLRWWTMAYLLILSCYFFVLALMPRRKKLAVLLSLGFFLSPFFHWWYVPSALATAYYSLFGMAVFVKLLHSKRRRYSLIWGLLLAYLAAAFILVLYPPFQIPCGIIIAVFAVGYTLNNKTLPKRILRNNLLYAAAALVVAATVTGLFLYQKRDVVTTLQNSVYPGHRIVESGGFSAAHLLSSDVSSLFQDKIRADSYSRLGATNAINQSESSNFMLVFPFLLIPVYYLAYRNYRQTKKLDYLLIGMSLVLIGFLAWMFIPGLSLFGKISLLDKVPLSRLILGFGLLNLIFLTLFIKIYSATKSRFTLRTSLSYAAAIFIFYLVLNFHLASVFPEFIGHKSAVIFAATFPIITFLLLRKYFTGALVVLALMSFFSVYKINPLYQGTAILTETPISKAIRETEPTSDKRWISEDIIIENFAAMNGRPSLTGVYVYPQLALWDGLGQTDKQSIYNRYAHVNFTFNRDRDTIKQPLLRTPSNDQFNVKISPCDPFFEKSNVGFLITSVAFDPDVNTCAKLLREVHYPKVNFHIYKLTF